MKRNGVAKLAAGNGLHLSTDTCAFCFHSLFPFLFVAILPFLLLRDDYYFPLCVFFCFSRISHYSTTTKQSGQMNALVHIL